MTTNNPNDLSNKHPNENRLARWPGRQIPFTGRAPYESGPDPGAEERREEALELIRQHADDISKAALKYFIPPETIAGAILWEAIENYKPKFLDSAGPGRVHNETAFLLWKDGKVPSRYTPFDIRNPVVAIEYIAVIMRESASNYELIAGVNIEKNVGVLNTLYQGGDSKGKAEKLRDARRADLAAKRPLTLPKVPPREMGEYVENYRLYMRNQLLRLPLEKEGSGKENIDKSTTKLNYQLAASKIQAKASKFSPLGLDVRNEKDLHVAIAITGKIGGWDSEKILKDSPYSKSLSPGEKESWLEGINNKANELVPSKVNESNMQSQTPRQQMER
jgi:Protein of unknown function (DUF1402)